MDKLLLKVRLLSVIALCAFSAACAVNPVTGEQELSLVSDKEALSMGQKNYQPSLQSQGGVYNLDPELQAYVKEIGKNLAAVSHRPELPYEFTVLNSSVPNAWALPGGKIAINRGLLIHLEDESELAAVIGHEIVHAAAGHGAAQMSKSTLMGLGAQLASIASRAGGFGDLGGQAASIGGQAWLASYGREDELESDAYGMEYMVKLGYDPQGAVDLQKTFVKLSEGHQQDFISGLFASHPPSRERVVANQKRAAEMAGGQRYRERYQQKIAQLKKDQPAYELQDQADKALKAKQYDQALSLIEQAIKQQPKAAEFWVRKGFALQAKEQLDAADKAYSQAVKLNDKYFRPLLLRGALRYQRGDKAGAKQDLQASYQLLPTEEAAKRLKSLEQ